MPDPGITLMEEHSGTKGKQGGKTKDIALGDDQIRGKGSQKGKEEKEHRAMMK